MCPLSLKCSAAEGQFCSRSACVKCADPKLGYRHIYDTCPGTCKGYVPPARARAQFACRPGIEQAGKLCEGDCTASVTACPSE